MKVQDGWILLSCLLVIGLVSACHSAAIVCQEDKFAFTQENACMNDGSVEFCILKDDRDALAQVLEIAPEADCTLSSPGRAGCKENERLCLIPVGDYCSEKPNSYRIAAAGWDRLCRLSELDFIQQIVATWYE
ncbi:hypothetical protein MASR2M15_05820 [Anaerolineales bacterium]